MNFNFKKLRLRILEKYDTIKAFADALGKDSSYVSRYLHNHLEFTATMIVEWARLLDITDIQEYFFCLDDLQNVN